MIDGSLFDCHVSPQQGHDGVTGSSTRVPDPFGNWVYMSLRSAFIAQLVRAWV